MFDVVDVLGDFDVAVGVGDGSWGDGVNEIVAVRIRGAASVSLGAGGVGLRAGSKGFAKRQAGRNITIRHIPMVRNQPNRDLCLVKVGTMSPGNINFISGHYSIFELRVKEKKF